MLKKSLMEFGDLGCIIFNRKSKALVGGHQRVQNFDADAEIVLETELSKPNKVGTIAEGFVVLNGERFKYREVMWDANKEKAANIAANKNAGEWNIPELTKIMFELKSIDFDLNLTMFDFKERKDYFNFIDVAAHSRQASEDNIPTKIESICKPGDTWQLGVHRLMCGDSKNITNIDSLRNGVEIDLLLTDPPYGMSVVKTDGHIGGKRVGKNGYGKKGQYGKEAECGIYKPIIGDDEPFDPNCCFGVSRQQIIFGANHFADRLPRSPHWIVWYKDMPVGTDFSGAELAWTSINKKAVKTYKFTWNGMTREGNRKDELSKRVHPTQKPVGLFEAILKDYECQTVLDLFGGSGSTLIACEKTNRKCFMMELDAHYCDVILARWEKYTGKKAIKIS